MLPNTKLCHAAYSNFVEPTTRELEQIEAQLEQLQEQRVTLEELTEQVRAEAIDLAGTWERGSLETKLDLQRGLFGRSLFFEPETVDPFLRVKGCVYISQNTNRIPTSLKAGSVSQWMKMRKLVKLGWETGIEPATFGATDRRSTS